MKPASTGSQPPSRRSRDASPRRVLALVAMLLLVVAAPVVAGTVSCSVSAPNVSFGSYDVFAGSQITSTTTISVRCTMTGGGGNTDVSYVIALSPGLSNTFVQRTMKSGANALGYNLYSNSTRTTVWGDGTGAAPTVSGSMTLKNNAPTHTDSPTVYGSVPALQDVGVGAYSDNVTITVTY
jgi:spore coat protein U-like protein